MSIADAAQSPEMVPEMVNGDDDRYEVQYIIQVYENWDNDNNGNTGSQAGGAANVQETKHEFVISEKTEHVFSIQLLPRYRLVNESSVPSVLDGS